MCRAVESIECDVGALQYVAAVQLLAIESIECDVGAGCAAEVQGWPPSVGGGGLEAREASTPPLFLHQKTAPPETFTSTKTSDGWEGGINTTKSKAYSPKTFLPLRSPPPPPSPPPAQA